MTLISISRQSGSQAVGWLMLLFVTAAIGFSHAVEPYSDPEGLISFSVPDAWTLNSESSGMRFRRAAEKERTVLSVYPRSQADGFDPEKLRTTRLSQVRSQSRDVVTDTEYTLDQFRVWELLVRPGPDGRGPISHSLHLLNGNLHIEIMLIATPDRYPAYVDDLRAVAESVRTTDATR